MTCTEKQTAQQNFSRPNTKKNSNTHQKNRSNWWLTPTQHCRQCFRSLWYVLLLFVAIVATWCARSAFSLVQPSKIRFAFFFFCEACVVMLWACVLVGALRTALGLLFALCCDEAHGRMRVERTVDRLLGGASVWHAARRLVIIFFSLSRSLLAVACWALAEWLARCARCMRLRDASRLATCAHRLRETRDARRVCWRCRRSHARRS